MSKAVSNRKFWVFVGMRGCGKSTNLAKIIKAYKQNVILIKFAQAVDDPAHRFLTQKTISNWRQGAAPNEFVKCKIAVYDDKELNEICDWALKHFRNGLFIFDDATTIIEHQLPKHLRRLISINRHIGIDVIMVYHGLTHCPIDQFKFLDDIFIFNTNDNSEYKKAKISNWDKVQAAVTQAKRNFQSTNDNVKFSPIRVNVTSM